MRHWNSRHLTNWQKKQHDCDDVLIVTLLYTISVEAAKQLTGTQLEHNNQVIFCKHKLLQYTLKPFLMEVTTYTGTYDQSWQSDNKELRWTASAMFFSDFSKTLTPLTPSQATRKKSASREKDSAMCCAIQSTTRWIMNMGGAIQRLPIWLQRLQAFKKMLFSGKLLCVGKRGGKERGKKLGFLRRWMLSKSEHRKHRHSSFQRKHTCSFREAVWILCKCFTIPNTTGRVKPGVAEFSITKILNHEKLFLISCSLLEIWDVDRANSLSCLEAWDPHMSLHIFLKRWDLGSCVWPTRISGKKKSM